MGEKLTEIAGALYQVHSFAKLIGDNYDDITSSDYNGGASDPILSFIDLVQEKAEFCLQIIDGSEEKEVTT